MQQIGDVYCDNISISLVNLENVFDNNIILINTTFDQRGEGGAGQDRPKKG